MSHHDCARKQTRPIGMIRVVVGVDDVLYRAIQAVFQVILDSSGFFREEQGVNEDSAFAGDYSSCCNLDITFAGKNKYVVGNTFTLHRLIVSMITTRRADKRA